MASLVARARGCSKVRSVVCRDHVWHAVGPAAAPGAARLAARRLSKRRASALPNAVLERYARLVRVVPCAIPFEPAIGPRLTIGGAARANAVRIARAPCGANTVAVLGRAGLSLLDAATTRRGAGAPLALEVLSACFSGRSERLARSVAAVRARAADTRADGAWKRGVLGTENPFSGDAVELSYSVVRAWLCAQLTLAITRVLRDEVGTVRARRAFARARARVAAAIGRDHRALARRALGRITDALRLGLPAAARRHTDRQRPHQVSDRPIHRPPPLLFKLARTTRCRQLENGHTLELSSS